MSKVVSIINAVIVALVFVNIFSMISSQAQATDTVSVEYSIYPETIKPGTGGYIQIKLTNAGAQTIYDLYVFRIKAEDPLKIFDTHKKIGDLYPGMSKTIISRFEVSEKSKAGYYLVELILKSKYGDSSRFDIPIEVREESNIKLSVTPEEVESNSQANLSLVIENRGGEIRDVRISWSSGSVLPLTESSTLFIPSMKSGEIKEAELRVKTTNPGTAVMLFNVTYTDPTGNSVFETHTIALDVKSREESFLNVELKPEALEVGKAGRLVFTVSNEGGKELRNILLSWNSNVLLPASSSSEFIDVLKPGESRIVAFDVFVDEKADPGYYSVPLMINYDSSGVTKVANRTFAVMLEGDISLTATLFRAESNKVFISIANTGNAPAKNLVAYASSTYGKAEVFIGDMDPGDEEIIEVDQLGVDTSKPYNLTLRLEYRDVFDNQFVEEKEINVHHFRESFSATLAAGALVVLALIVAGVWIWRKR
jgi:hypothetical protein